MVIDDDMLCFFCVLSDFCIRSLDSAPISPTNADDDDDDDDDDEGHLLWGNSVDEALDLHRVSWSSW